MTYLRYLQMALNMPRCWTKHAVAAGRGQALLGSEDLDWSWADAVADEPEEAQEVLDEANSRRAAARARAKMWRGG